MKWYPHERLVTIEEAAEVVHRTPGTIWRWVHEGRLAPRATKGKRHLYLEADVLRADGETTRRRNTQ